MAQGCSGYGSLEKLTQRPNGFNMFNQGQSCDPQFGSVFVQRGYANITHLTLQDFDEHGLDTRVLKRPSGSAEVLTFLKLVSHDVSPSPAPSSQSRSFWMHRGGLSAAGGSWLGWWQKQI